MNSWWGVSWRVWTTISLLGEYSKHTTILPKWSLRYCLCNWSMLEHCKSPVSPVQGHLHPLRLRYLGIFTPGGDCWRRRRKKTRCIHYIYIYPICWTNQYLFQIWDLSPCKKIISTDHGSHWLQLLSHCYHSEALLVGSLKILVNVHSIYSIWGDILKIDTNKFEVVWSPRIPFRESNVAMGNIHIISYIYI